MRIPQGVEWCQEIESREQFGLLLNRRNLIGHAVEVGTHQAEFASAFLRGWQGKILTCIDPWRDNLPNYQDPLAGRERTQDLLVAIQALREFEDRVRIVLQTSPQASWFHVDESLDFVYLDGNHAESAVAQDIAAWWPKLRPGGVLAGHDWGHEWRPAIQAAVLNHTRPLGLTVRLVQCPIRAYSWFVEKPAEA